MKPLRLRDEAVPPSVIGPDSSPGDDRRPARSGRSLGLLATPDEAQWPRLTRRPRPGVAHRRARPRVLDDAGGRTRRHVSRHRHTPVIRGVSPCVPRGDSRGCRVDSGPDPALLAAGVDPLMERCRSWIATPGCDAINLLDGTKAVLLKVCTLYRWRARWLTPSRGAQRGGPRLVKRDSAPKNSRHYSVRYDLTRAMSGTEPPPCRCGILSDAVAVCPTLVSPGQPAAVRRRSAPATGDRRRLIFGLGVRVVPGVTQRGGSWSPGGAWLPKQHVRGPVACPSTSRGRCGPSPQ